MNSHIYIPPSPNGLLDEAEWKAVLNAQEFNKETETIVFNKQKFDEEIKTIVNNPNNDGPLRWAKLHLQPFTTAQRIANWFYKEWLPLSQEGCCGRVLDELDECPIVFDNETSFFYSGVKFHNYINRKLGYPQLQYQLANHIWRKNKPIHSSREVAIVSSLAPKRLDHQLACIRTWLSSGFFVYLMQNKNEIADLKPRAEAAGIFAEWIPVPTQRPLIRDMAHYGMILNSDVAMMGAGQLSIYPNSMYLRWNYDPMSPSQEEEWGIDCMYLDPHAIPDDLPFMIGEPFWDYSIPALFRHNNIPFTIKHTPWLQHQRHELNWNQTDWQRGHKWVANRVPGDLSSHEFRKSLDPLYTYSKQQGLWKSTQESTHTQTPSTTSVGHQEELNISLDGPTIKTTS